MGLPSFFSIDEIECKCGCGFEMVRPHFYFKMNLLRCCMGGALHITSWCRCAEHNKKGGGSITSSHLEGVAADIWVITNLERYRLIRCAGDIGFRGIGIAETFMHFDDDPAKAEGRLWLY